MRSPDGFPADIIAAAENALDRLLCNCRESCGSTEAVRLASISEIARALMERDRAATERAAKMEQERCAKIAASFAWRTELALEIAAAIRGELEGATADAAAIRSQP
jgi:hypothetical protein